jgi:hypothetical protein
MLEQEKQTKIKPKSKPKNTEKIRRAQKRTVKGAQKICVKNEEIKD